MKIMFDQSISRVGNNAVKLNKKAETENPVVKKAGVFDEVKLSQRDSREPSDIIEGVKKQTASDISSNAPAKELEDIRRQIAEGNYEANASQIAGRLLFDIM